MATLLALVLALVLAFPFTWALQGIYESCCPQWNLDPSVTPTDIRMVIVMVLLTLVLLRDRRNSEPSPPRRSR